MTFLVVPSNVEKYDAIYKEGYDKKYPSLDLVRLEAWYFKKHLGKVLDYGCGTGTNSIHLLECGYEVTAADAATESLNLTRAKLDGRRQVGERLRLCLISPTDRRLAFEDGSFDYVICLSVLSLLETRERISALISEFYRVLKPGGKMIVDINGPDSDFASKGRFVSEDTFEFFLRRGDEGPLRCYCPRTKEKFAELFKDFCVDDIGHVSFEYVGEQSYEYIACVRKEI